MEEEWKENCYCSLTTRAMAEDSREEELMDRVMMAKRLVAKGQGRPGMATRSHLRCPSTRSQRPMMLAVQ